MLTPDITQETPMKAITQDTYGTPDVLAFHDIAMPTPGDDDVLIAVRASSVNPADWHMATGTPYMVRVMGGGLLRPKRSVPGSDVAGRVEAVGKNVTEFQPGDDVYGEIGGGAYAESVAISAERVVAKPTTLSYEQAAAIPVAALTALQGLRDHGNVQPGHHVLINGASGGVGTFAVQIAKELGATVTAVCSTRNVELVRSLGADHVIDYTQDDFTLGEARYDVMLDNVGNRSLAECRSVLTDDGVYVMVGGQKHRWLGPVRRMLRAQLSFLRSPQRFAWFVATPNRADMLYLKGLAEAGTLTPVIDRRFTLSEVPAALEYLAEGHSRGKSVITV